MIWLVNLLTDYKLNQGSLSNAQSSPGSLSSASLCNLLSFCESCLNQISLSYSSSLDFSIIFSLSLFHIKILKKDTGLQFNSNLNQYLEIPGFIPSGQDVLITTSISFHFYLKIDEAPATTANILSYYCHSVNFVFKTSYWHSIADKRNIYSQNFFKYEIDNWA